MNSARRMPLTILRYSVADKGFLAVYYGGCAEFSVFFERRLSDLQYCIVTNRCVSSADGEG